MKQIKDALLHFLIHLISFVLNFMMFVILMIIFYRDHNIVTIQVVNFISWIISMLFIFFIDKVFVPDLVDENNSAELFKFFLIRGISLVLESLILFIFVSVINLNFFTIKFISLLILFVVNYVYVKKIKF